VAISPDGKMLASACRDENDPTVSLWDTATGAEVQQLRLKPPAETIPAALRARDAGPEPLPAALAFASDGSTLATLDTWGFLWLWETRTSRPLRHIASRCRGFAFTPDGSGLFADDGAGLKQFDAKSGKERRRFEGPSAHRRRVAGWHHAADARRGNAPVLGRGNGTTPARGGRSGLTSIPSQPGRPWLPSPGRSDAGARQGQRRAVPGDRIGRNAIA
jgi:WD40 repeat protein